MGHQESQVKSIEKQALCGWSRATTTLALCQVMMLGIVWVGPAFGEATTASSPAPQIGEYTAATAGPQDEIEDVFSDWSSEVTTPPPIRRQNLSLNEMTPIDPYARVELVLKELDLIRVEMGKPKANRSPLQVSQAAPFEVYFQARTLYEKANRLAFEQTGSLGQELEAIPASEVQPGNVWSVVDAALQRILKVKSTLGISGTVTETLPHRAIVPTDVFLSIVMANRQLNVLLERQYAPRDVFRQVTVAIHYTATLLSRFPGSQRIPKPLPIEHGKTPANVYHRLGECVSRLVTIADWSGVSLLDVEVAHTSQDSIQPSDVYDLASLLVSDLAYLHSQLPGLREPYQAFDPGRKFPSHVYQRAGMLLDQINHLAQYVEAHPKWLQG